MAFWNKKETNEVVEFVSTEIKIAKSYADQLIGLASRQGYEYDILDFDSETKTVRVELPKAKLDKVLGLCFNGIGAKFM